jgi:hypothetical protein
MTEHCGEVSPLRNEKKKNAHGVRAMDVGALPFSELLSPSTGGR